MNRRLILKTTLGAAVLAAGLAISTAFVPDALASSGGCSVTCKDKSTCSAQPDPGEICTCTCTFWGLKTASCSCETLQPVIDG